MLSDKKTIYISLCSNLDDRLDFIKNAIKLISEIDAVSIEKLSGVYESEPYGKTDQPKFLNCIAKLHTGINPSDLLSTFKGIEKSLGRKETERWGPRIIDIDILLYNDQIVNTTDLKIPHPDLLNRDFIIKPLLELDADVVYPVKKVKISELVKDKKLSGRATFYTKLDMDC